MVLPSLGIALIVTLSSAHAGTPDCHPNDPPGTICKQKLQDLRITQSSVGFESVEVKVEQMDELSDAELKDYLKKKLIPVVIGPGDQFYMIDHHHMVKALSNSGRRDDAYIVIKENWSALSQSEFEKKMVEFNYVWLFDEHGNPITFDDLPKTGNQLKDDRFRSLAYFVREEGGYQKTGEPFVENQWAQFFRKLITLASGKKGMKKATREAIILARTPAAAKLPGYIPDCPRTLKPN